MEAFTLIKQIRQIGDPVLRAMAETIEDPTAPAIKALAKDMADTLRDFQKRTGYGRGIAAPQVGVSKRMVVVDMPELGGVTTLVNPEITWKSDDKFLVWDACFSYFFLFFLVVRHNSLVVRFTDLAGADHTIQAEDDLSELLQHEIEHLDGEMAIDKVYDPRSFHTVAEWEARVKPTL